MDKIAYGLIVDKKDVCLQLRWRQPPEYVEFGTCPTGHALPENVMY
jgi:hypothetical protein